MGLLDELKAIPPKSLGGSSKQFIDADTLHDTETNERYRIQGINAAEIEKITASGEYKQGTAGGAATTDIIHGLANAEGYDNVVPLMNPDGTVQRDPFGRVVADLQDKNGNSFRRKLLEAGAFDVNKYTTTQDIAARDIAEARRNQAKMDGSYVSNAFDEAATKINQAELAEGQKSLGFKITATNEAERAQYAQALIAEGKDPNDYLTNSVQVRHYDRDLDNNSLNPFSDSWNQGWISMGEAAYGMANLLGTETGLEGLAEWGEQGVARSQAALGDYASTILNYDEVESFGDAFEYLGNNLAMSLPYMVGTIGGAAVTAASAPVLGTAGAVAAGLAAPASIYSGQIWNEQEGENKNAAAALAGGVLQASFDRIGLKFAAGPGKSSKALFNDAVSQFAKQQGVPMDVAKKAVSDMSRRELAGLAGDVSNIAKNQLGAKQLFKDMGGAALVGAAGEGLTEAGQELIGYTAAHTQGGFDFHELNNRMISAAIAGASLGGAMATPGSFVNQAAWADVAFRTQEATSDTESESGKYALEEKEKYGRIMSIDEIAADARARAESQPGLTIDERTQYHNEAQKGKSTYDIAGEKLGNIQALWQGSVRNIFTPELQSKSRAARQLADMFGGNLQRIYSGSNFENSKHHRVAVYKNMVSDPRDFYNSFGAWKKSQKDGISDAAYQTLNKAVDKNGKFDPNLIPEDTKNRAMIQKLGTELNTLADQMLHDQRKHNPELGKIDNYLFKYKALDKGAINKRQGDFKRLLMKEFEMDDATAQQTVDNILDSVDMNDLETATEAFSVVKGGIQPAAHKKRTLGLSEKEAFQDFFEKDLFSNVSNAVKSAARYTAHRDFIGENGKVVSKLLDDMQAEGVPEAEVNKVAKQLQDYLDAESGNYNRAQTKAGKTRERIQKNFMMWTTLSSLPLAVISSIVEFALVHKGLTPGQIFGGKGTLEGTAKELAAGMMNTINKQPVSENRKRAGLEQQDMLKHLGFRDWDVGAATTTGVTEINSWQQPLYEWFFKWNGLQGWTNYTRSIRAGIAGDYMMDKAQMIADQRRSGNPRTREIQEAEEALRNLGIDVDQYVELAQKKVANLPLTPEEETFMADTTREATFNFVNDAVALPQAANRPLIYQDPRFALFTQFQGFMATFTANHIPKLWGEYVKRGTPAMKYSAFATMATMIMLGFLSQHFKDAIKYGFSDEDDETGLNPYLDTPEYIQRGIRASGLLGTGERVLDMFMPIYEQRSRGVGDWAWNQVSGESPAIGFGERIAKGLGSVAEGNTEKGTYQLLKAAPGLGPATALNKGLASLITTGDWNYQGDSNG